MRDPRFAGDPEAARDAEGRRRVHPGPSHDATSARVRADAPGALTACPVAGHLPPMPRPILLLALLCRRSGTGASAPRRSTTRASAPSAPATCCATSSSTRSRVRQSIAPDARAGRLASDRGARLPRRPRGAPSPPASFTAARTSTDTDLGTLRTGHAHARPRGPDLAGVRAGALGSAASSTGRRTTRESSCHGGTPRFLAGAGVDYRRPVLREVGPDDLGCGTTSTASRPTRSSARLLPDSGREPRLAVRRPLAEVSDDRRARWSPRLAVAAPALACGDIASPCRDDFYEWRLEAPSPSGDRASTRLSFHWPAERLPVRDLGGADRSACRPTWPGAISVVAAAFLYGEFDATVVADSSDGRRDRPRRLPPGTQLSAARLHSALAPQCAGATDVDVERRPHAAAAARSGSTSIPSSAPTTPGLSECLALTTTHELGHASASSGIRLTPLISCTSTPRRGAERAGPQTAEVLYHFPSTRRGRAAPEQPCSTAAVALPARNLPIIPPAGTPADPRSAGRVLCRAATRHRSV